MTKRECYSALRPMLDAQIPPMIFTFNPGEGAKREAKPMSEQYVEFMNEIGRVYKKLKLAQSSDFDSEEFDRSEMEEQEEISETACDNCGQVKDLFHDEASGQSLCEDCLPDEITEDDSDTIEAKGKKRIKDEIRYFVKRIRELREFVNGRITGGEPMDRISMRPTEQAVKLIPAGIPADALLFSVTMTWPEDVRKDAGVKDFDFVALSQKIMRERDIEGWRDSKGGRPHKMFGYALVLAENGVPLFLIGPAGTGKSHLAWQISDFMFGSEDRFYGETPMSAGASRNDLLGRITPSGYVISEFVVRYSQGGVFNFEEIDAALPEVLIALNNALARDTLFNSVNSEVYTKHAKFIPIACGNTPGLGATREFTARERLDAATLDRWTIGRIFLELDETVEDHIAGLI